MNQAKFQKAAERRALAAIEQLKRQGRWAGAVQAHAEYQNRPVEWIVEKLGIPEHTIRWSLNPGYEDHEWDGDVDPLVATLEAIFRGESVAVSAGTGTAKTHTLAACGALAFLGCFQDSIVLFVAPKQDLLLKNAWKEIGRLWPRFRAHFPGAALLTGNLRMRGGEGEQELWAATAFGAGVGAEEEMAQRLKGFHAARMLWIVEETPGVDQAIINTIVKTSTGDFNPILALGNPEHQHDTLALFSKREWVKAVRISALDFPNVVTGQPIIPGGRSRESVARDLQDANGNENDPFYLSQVRGIAPAQSDMALVRREWCDAAVARYSDHTLRVGPLALGADPSNSESHGKAALARWQGACLTEVERRVCADASVFGREIYEEALEQGIDPQNIGCDDIGNASSTINKLKELGFYIRALNGAAKPEVRIDEDLRYRPQAEGSDPENPTGPVVVGAERFFNLRAQMYWKIREDLRLGRIALPNDPELIEELCVFTWERKNGKILLSPKEAAIHKLGRSPDRADAACYGNWVRTRRPLAAVSTAKPAAKHYDSGFDQLLATLSVDSGDAFVTRRPF